MIPQPGHLYIVGVGPGAPDLLTLRALHVIQGCDVLVAPRSEQSSESLALGIVKEHLRTPTILEHVYPMTRDLEGTRASWSRVAEQVLEHLHAERSVAHITLGDPLLYSTSSYLLEPLRPHVPPERIHIVPGISALQAAAAAFGNDLALQEDRLVLMPATDLAAVEHALDTHEHVILYKVGHRLDALIDLLERKNLLAQARLAYAVEQDRQRLIWDLRQARNTRLGYMSVLLVRTGHRGWEDLP